MPDQTYESPLSTRYASKEMAFLFSKQFKYQTFRNLWIALAKAQKRLGLKISQKQIREMQNASKTIDYAKVAVYEKKLKHDVMAHIHAFADQCPSASPIIHLGATSCYVTDNTDLIQIQKATSLLLEKLLSLIQLVTQLAKKYRSLPCLSYTHFQPAQPTTMGKRFCIWLQDFLIDYYEWSKYLQNIRFLGTKGATGTQASFYTLFDHNHKKVQELEALTAKEMGFSHSFLISGQTYSRKLDVLHLNSLEAFASSAHKCATDIRLLMHTGELCESFGKDQVGSSAMPFKRNPIYAERVCSLSRYLIAQAQNAAYTEATQWLERSLDDSANRRMSIAESFLTADAILNLLLNIFSEIHVNEKTISKLLKEKLPFLAMEYVLMQATKKGGNRQKIHEQLRKISQLSSPEKVLEKIAKEFGTTKKELLQEKNYIGRAPEQVSEFITKEIQPLLKKIKQKKNAIPQLNV